MDHSLSASWILSYNCLKYIQKADKLTWNREQREYLTKERKKGIVKTQAMLQFSQTT